jgi:uridine kinase
MMDKKAILIGIAGGTGSGKTSIAKAIASDFGKSEVALIEQDSYYKDLSNLDFEARAAINFDHPDSVDFPLMKSHLADLVMGKNVNIPIYDFTSHTRKKETMLVEKNHIIIMEGILALFDQDIRELMDIKLYVETADDIRIIRRIKRDIEDRDRTFTSVIEQYYKTVRPMHIQFVEPTKKYADIIIPEGGRNKVAIDILRTKLMTLILHQKTEL